MADRYIIQEYLGYEDLEPFEWKEEPLIRIAFVFLFFALLFTFYFNNLILIGVILYLIAIVLPIYPIFEFMARRDAHQPRPNIEDIDEIFFSDIEEIIRPTAIRSLELEENELENSKICLIAAPSFLKDSGAQRFQGDDGIFRYSNWEFLVLAFMDRYLCVFECSYDFFYGSVSNQRVTEFFYNDIITVKSAMVEKERELMDGSVISEVEVFRLLTLSGESIDLEINRSTMYSYPQLDSYIMEANQEVRRMLREKKYKGVDMEIIRTVEKAIANSHRPVEEEPETDDEGNKKMPPAQIDNDDDMQDFEGAI